jgi:hypothetical protein
MPVPGEDPLRYEIDFVDPEADGEPDEEYLRELEEALSRMQLERAYERGEL